MAHHLRLLPPPAAPRHGVAWRGEATPG
uniref:Uncharacterized protein n=1 Tax=Arundo donax TaxID=35708 RepID=A0A0A9GFD0_ARUDO